MKPNPPTPRADQTPFPVTAVCLTVPAGESVLRECACYMSSGRAGKSLTLNQIIEQLLGSQNQNQPFISQCQAKGTFCATLFRSRALLLNMNSNQNLFWSESIFENLNFNKSKTNSKAAYLEFTVHNFQPIYFPDLGFQIQPKIKDVYYVSRAVLR